jgi:hypothetical protein
MAPLTRALVSQLAARWDEAARVWRKMEGNSEWMRMIRMMKMMEMMKKRMRRRYDSLSFELRLGWLGMLANQILRPRFLLSLLALNPRMTTRVMMTRRAKTKIR